ncbi:MAG: ATP-binding cassette domain-containing protein [Devosia nanyangense]|uniref:ATP-binding cassette domain-containing protein n=1 Tax=Devosia nanyangense TaxID=1228055 RepID=A0A933KYB2_9HYPH|nr:ATP-binding cassette domain-containing protein [Devosia nanyangense]
MLAVDDVIFVYAGWPDSYRFSMEAAAGEITAVRGASGAGKSTLLDLVAGFLVPTSGSIRVGGADISALPPERRPVSILFQAETLFEHLSAARNVALGLPGERVGSPRIAAALAEVGLPDIGAQRAATLSGGQKQRVALARTLLRDKPVLLLDEPFSALDDETRAATRGLVQSLTLKHKWATVLVTHHADDISAIADRVYLLENGVLRAA